MIPLIQRQQKVKKQSHTEQLHSPDGEKRGGANAASSLAPLVMHDVKMLNSCMRLCHEPSDAYCNISS